MATTSCEGCRSGDGFSIPLRMAFQPIVDVSRRAVFAYEALVRGQAGEGAAAVMAEVTPENRYAFDQKCRVAAITKAAELGLADQGAFVSINFLPNAVYEPDVCIKLTLATARKVGFPTRQIIFEFTEDEQIDSAHLGGIITTYKRLGFKTAIDDFGAGYSGLNLLAKFQPDIVKLDMGLIRNVDTDRIRRALVAGVVRICRDIGVEVLAEGIETLGEHLALTDMGIDLQQGYLFARPALEQLATPVWPQSPSLASVKIAAA